MEDMFRYLEKYTGKYRVLPLLDLETNDFPRDENGEIDEDYDDLYIPFKGGIQIRHTYIKDTLAIFILDKADSAATKIIDKIHEKYFDVNLDLDRVGRDAFIYFSINDMDKVAEVLGARTSGARIKWYAKSNIKKVSK